MNKNGFLNIGIIIILVLVAGVATGTIGYFVSNKIQKARVETNQPLQTNTQETPQAPTTKDVVQGSDNCDFPGNSIFLSINEYPGILGELGNRQVSFYKNKYWVIASDVSEWNFYTCKNNVLDLKYIEVSNTNNPIRSIKAYYDANTKTLTLDGIEYKISDDPRDELPENYQPQVGFSSILEQKDRCDDIKNSEFQSLGYYYAGKIVESSLNDRLFFQNNTFTLQLTNIMTESNVAYTCENNIVKLNLRNNNYIGLYDPSTKNLTLFLSRFGLPSPPGSQPLVFQKVNQ